LQERDAFVPFGPLLDDPRAPMMVLELIAHRGHHVDRKPVAGLGIVLAGLLAGCGAPTPPQIAIANRSDAILTVGPGLVIPACGSTTTSQADYETARTKAGEMAMNGQTWDAPAGALVWTNLAFATARGTVPTGTITLVVSSTADPVARSGTVAEDTLPACGGQPRGIEPGLPQGEEPMFTLEPLSP
jgi:hypothetical protein